MTGGHYQGNTDMTGGNETSQKKQRKTNETERRMEQERRINKSHIGHGPQEATKETKT